MSRGGYWALFVFHYMRIGGQRIPNITLVLVASESILIGICLLVATAFRFRDAELLTGALRLPGTMPRFSAVILVCVLSLYYYDLYDLQIVRRRWMLLVQLLQALGAACIILAFLYYLAPDLSFGRSIAAVAAPIIVALVLGWRLLVYASLPVLRRDERILIVGTGPAGVSLAEEVLARPELGLCVVGFLDESDRLIDSDWIAASAGSRTHLGDSNGHKGELEYVTLDGDGYGNIAVLADDAPSVESSVRSQLPCPILGSTADVARLAVAQRVDRVVLSLTERRGAMPVRELLHLKFLGIKVEEVHTIYERIAGRILLDHLSPSWLIFSDGFDKAPALMAVKRFTDVVLAALALLIALPFMAAIALAVFIESGGPVLFRQNRVGQNGHVFRMLKFRSMQNEPAQQGPQWTKSSDHRITRVGRVIRKFRLDELPQLLNVLRGEMSLVGPRPEQPGFVEMLEQKIPYYGQRHTLRPGITGWAQVKYGYGGSVEETRTKLEHELFYIKHLSLALDLAIVFETGKVLLSGRGAK